MKTEKRCLTEFIELYRNLTCLWDTREVLYTNKEARDTAYETLLEKYKSVQEDASIMDVKKRIENMRCAYRRERKKVLKSKINGDEEYVPSLWYYEHFEFLNNIGDWSNLESVTISSRGEESMKVEYVNDETSGSHKSGRKSGKKRRASDSYSSGVPTIYIPELHDNDGIEHDQLSSSQEDTQTTVTTGFTTESEAFGTTVGLQLKELDPLQKLIAEKLISDVIFNARLKKLTVDSAIINLTE